MSIVKFRLFDYQVGKPGGVGTLLHKIHKYRYFETQGFKTFAI